MAGLLSRIADWYGENLPGSPIGRAVNEQKYRGLLMQQQQREWDTQKQQQSAAKSAWGSFPDQALVTPKVTSPEQLQQNRQAIGQHNWGLLNSVPQQQRAFWEGMSEADPLGALKMYGEQALPAPVWRDETASGLPGQRNVNTNEFDPFPQQTTPAKNNVRVQQFDVGETTKYGRLDEAGNFLGWVTDEGGEELGGPRYKPTPPNADPFQGRGQTIQFMNMLVRGRNDPTLRGTPEYAAAFSYLSRPQVSFDANGAPVYISPDVSWALPPASSAAPPAPDGGPAPAAAPAPRPGQPTITTGPQVKPMEASRAVQIANMNQASKDAASARSLFFPGGKYDRRLAAQAMANIPLSKGRLARQAMRRAVEVLLRLRTGAAAPAEEVENYTAMFSPSVADSEEAAAAKMDQLQAFFDDTMRMNGLPTGGAPAAGGGGSRYKIERVE